MDADLKSVEKMDKYHEYLEKNYSGGTERFFSPTGFLDKFQRKMEVHTQTVRNHIFAKTVDDAQSKMEPVVAGGEGVFDLTAEPGTGKTSVLPFRFPSKKVVVALPTPFDAWSAFNMATGTCMLRIKGLRLGSGADVVYMDSYMAANMVLSGFMDYDVLIIDECDSARGVTKFLAEVRAPGKVLIRMSASHGKTESGPSRAFRVTEASDMPDIRQDPMELARYVVKNHAGRSLLLVPDAETALDMGTRIRSAKVICTRSNLGDIARAMVNQEGDRLYIADDVCARGLNLNLDTVFDCQLVAEHGSLRPISDAELYQRKGRVGRNREGWYRSAGLGCKDVGESDIDVFRHNVCRAVASIRQEGGSRLQVPQDRLQDLMIASREPYVINYEISKREVAVTSSSSSDRDYTSPDEGRSSREGSLRSFKSGGSNKSVKPPNWLFHFAGGHMSAPKGKDVDTYLIKSGKNYAYAKRRTSSSSEEVIKSSGSRHSRSYREPVGTYDRESLPMVVAAPYAVEQRRIKVDRLTPLAIPAAPPVVDLTQLTYDMDWPSLIRDRLVNGGDLPTLVPPNSWLHTSVGGIGNDWLRRLDDLAVKDNSFDESEFEIVCRAWNKLVAQAWVKRTPGLNNYSSLDRLEYCARYFQSYFLLASTN